MANVHNQNVTQNLSGNTLKLFGDEEALQVFGTDLVTPIFSVDALTGEVVINGNMTVSGTVSGAAANPPGSAGAPSVTFSSDPDTGLYSAGADELGTTVGGSTKSNISSTSYTLQNLSGGLSLEPHGTLAGETMEFKMLELAANGTNYVALKAADALAANVTWTLPDADATVSGQILSSNSSGVLSWVNPTAGAGDLNDGGNTTAATVVIGTNDANSLMLETGGVNAVELDTAGDLNLLTENQLKLQDAAAGEYVGLKAPATVSASYTMTMPPAVGALNQVISAADGAGTLQWVTLPAPGAGDITDGGNTTAASVVIGTNDANSLILETNGTNAVEIDTAGDLNLLTENQIKLQDNTGGQYVGLKAPATVSASYTLTMPNAVGTNGQFLTTTAAGVLSWASSATGLISDGGDTTAATIVIGTNDANSLMLETGGVNAVELDTSGDLNLLTENQLKLQDNTGGQYVGLKAPATVSASYTLTMPSAAGSNGQFLTTTAGGVLSWASSATGLISDGGNTEGANVVIGTNDTFDLELEADGTTALTIESGGDTNVANTLKVDTITVSSGTTVTVGGLDNTQLTRYPPIWTTGSATENGYVTSETSNFSGSYFSRNVFDDGSILPGSGAAAWCSQLTALKLYDGVDNTYHAGGDSSTTVVTLGVVPGEYFQLQNTLGSHNLYKYVYRTDAGNGDPHLRSWHVVGSNDGITWTVVDTRTDETFTAYTTYEFIVNSAAQYSYYRVIATKIEAGAANQIMCVNEWTFYEAASSSLTSDGNINILSEKEMRLQDAADGEYVGFKAPATVSSSYTLTMPDAVGTVNQILSASDGVGTLQWVTPAATTGDIVDGGNTTAASVVIGTNDANSLILETNGANAVEIDTSGDLNLLTENQLKLQDNTGGQYVGWKAPAVVGASYTMTMPPAVGALNQVISAADGAGTLQWVTLPAPGAGDIIDGGNTTAASVVIGTNDANSLILETGGTSAVELDTAGDLNLLTENQLKLQDNTGGQYVGLKAPATVSASYTLTMPNAVGTNGQFLTTTAAGVLSWASSATGLISDGGDTTAATIVIGTNDANSLMLETGGVNAVELDTSGDLNMLTENAIKLQDSAGGEYVGIKAPATVSASYTLTMPPAVGTINQVISAADGAGTLQWVTPAAAGIGDIIDGGNTTGANVIVGTNDSFSLLLESNGVSAVEIDTAGDLNMLTENAIKLQDNTGGQYVGLKAPATVSASYTLTMPPAVGTNGQFLTTTAAGVLSWSSSATGLISDGGDTTGANVIVGTNDPFSLLLESNGVSAVEIDTAGDLNMLTENAIKLQDATGGQYVGMKAPATVSASYTLTMPPAVGTINQVISAADGAGTLQWVTPAAAGVGDITDGGNTTGAIVVVGTNDAFNLELEANGTTAFTVESSGLLGVANAIKLGAISETAEITTNTKNISFLTTLVLPGAAPTILQGGRQTSPSIMEPHDVAIDSSGNIWVVGEYNSGGGAATIVYDLGTGVETTTNNVTLPSITGNNTNFVIKYNSAGVALSSLRFLKNNQPNKNFTIAINDSDEVYIGGTLSSLVANTIKDMDTSGGTTSTNGVTFITIYSPCPFIVKLNNAGVVQSACQIFSHQNSEGVLYRLRFDSNNNLWAAGEVETQNNLCTLHNFSTTGGSPSAVTYGQTTIDGMFIIKYNSSDVPILTAQVESVQSVGGIGSHIVHAMVIDNNDDVYIAGRHRSSSASVFKDMNTNTGAASTVPTQNTSSNTNNVIVKYSNSGVVLGASFIDYDIAASAYFGLAVDSSDNLYVCGEYQKSGTALAVRNIDTSGGLVSGVTLPITTSSNRNGFVIKYNSSGVAQLATAVTQATGTSACRSISVDGENEVHVFGSKTTNTTAVNIFDMDAVGGTGIDLTYPTSVFSIFMLKFTAAGAFSSAGRLTSTAEPYGGNGSYPGMSSVYDNSKVFIVSGYSGTPSVYDYDTAGGTTANVTIGASTGSTSSSMLMVINAGEGSSSDTFKLVSNLTANDAGLVKTFSNDDVASKTVNIRNSVDTSTLSTVAFTETAQFVWTGTAWRKLFST
jgi:hypothetical protein